MHFLTSAIVLALSTVTLAQTTSAGALTACAAAPIVESCLASTGITVQNCPVQDYNCLCAAYQAVATCYNNCPNDQRAPSAQQQVVANCAAASQLSVLSAQTATGSSTIKTSTTAASVDAQTTSESKPTSTGAATTTKASAAAALKNNVAAGGLAGVAAVVAALL